MKSYTDIEQSKKLAEILPLESADMCYLQENGQAKTISPSKLSEILNVSKPQVIPCWSLAALLDVLPNASILLKGFDKIYDLTNSSGEIAKADNPVDVCYRMILKLNELKML